MKNLYHSLLMGATLLLSALNVNAAGGPDAYGYVWLDSNDPGGPTYSWIDITSIGTPVTGLSDDNSVGMISMGMNFQYYWQSYNQLKIGSNGWLGFDNIGNIAHCFPQMPTAGGAGDNFVAPFMSDLIFDGSGNPAQMYTYYDSGTQQFIVSYHDVPWWSANAPGYVGSNTFQVIFAAADSSITFQYQTTDAINFNDQTGCLADLEIGIENLTGNIGLEVYNDVVPSNTYAVKFYYPNPVLLAVPDASPIWNVQEGSKAKFFDSGSAFSLSTNIGNLGNTDITTAITINISVQDLLGTTVYSNSALLSAGMVAGDDSTFNFSGVGPLAVGQYNVIVTTTNSLDINPSNNSNSAEIGVVDVSSGNMLLSYATQGPVMGNLSWTSGGGLGIFVKPPTYPMTLDSVAAFIVNAGLAEDYFLQVLDDDGPNGSPGTILWEDTVFAGTYLLDSWVFTSLNSPVQVTSGGIYIAWIHQSTNTIALGNETVFPISRQTYEYLGSWTEYRDNSIQEFLLNGYWSTACASLSANFGGVTDASCYGGSDGAIDLTVSGGTPGYTYQWSNGFTTEDISGLAAGTYTLNVTDNNGCARTDSVVVGEAPNIITGTAITDVSCNGLSDGMIDMNVSGATPGYTYSWDNGAGTNQDASNLSAGTYTVTITDGAGCTFIESHTVNEPDVLALTSTSTDEMLGNDGTIDLTVAGGTAPFSYSWDNGAGTNEDPTNLAAGTYIVTVTDANGCTEVHTVVVGSQVGLIDHLNPAGNLHIFPNPSNGQFNIRWDGSVNDQSRLELVNALGQTLKTQSVEALQTITLDTPGLYFVRLVMNDVTVVKPLVIR